MARTIDTFPVEHERKTRGRYPWDEWSTGSVVECTKGTEEEVKAGKADFSVNYKSFLSAADQAATSRKGEFKKAVLDGGSRVVLQFVKGDNGKK